jgi:hypothetical protein
MVNTRDVVIFGSLTINWVSAGADLPQLTINVKNIYYEIEF